MYKALGIYDENGEDVWKDNGGYKTLAANVIRAGVRDEVSRYPAADFYKSRSTVRGTFIRAGQRTFIRAGQRCFKRSTVF